jgi:hypothetical protein
VDPVSAAVEKLGLSRDEKESIFEVLYGPQRSFSEPMDSPTQDSENATESQASDMDLTKKAAPRQAQTEARPVKRYPLQKSTTLRVAARNKEAVQHGDKGGADNKKGRAR